MNARTIARALGRSARGLLVAALSTALLIGMALPATAADDAFPLTVVDDEGTEVTIEALPQRIISLAPSNTEIVYALGAGDRLVGRVDYDDYPPEVVAVPPVITQGVIDFEQLVALEPDLVLAHGNAFIASDDLAHIRDLGYPVIVVHAPDVPGVLEDIELVGEAIAATDEAANVIAEMRAGFAAIAEAVAAVGSRPRVLYEIDATGEIYAPARESFLADMIVLAGGEPITTTDPSVWSIPLEELVVADPEVIVLGDAIYGTCPDAVSTRAGWGGMTAVVNGDVRPVDDVPITRPGPRLTQGLASLARAIHPELELTDFPADPPMCEAA